MQHSALNKFLPQKSKGRYVFYGGGGGGGVGGVGGVGRTSQNGLMYDSSQISDPSPTSSKTKITGSENN